ncbi:MAG: FAD-dependent oxidoreductase [Acidobacteria bacterium]|nr:FAD-dependent oxidoreductase [Acidobacteriota bacterium]
MIVASELQNIPIFACLDEADRQRFAEGAADVRLQSGEWLIREGETAYFFVLLEGVVQLSKDILGRSKDLYSYRVGEFFGEVPILLGAPVFASVQATSTARVARFDAQSLFEMIQCSAACSALILQTMTDRLMSVQRFAKETPASRVTIIGTQYDTECRDIRAFLSANRIPFEWIDAERDPERIPTCMGGRYDGPRVIVDRQYCVETTTVRDVANALGIRTAPRYQEYDVVVAGAGPAGLAAGVYGASEGLKVLIVERSAAGGQAGTSSRIENYLGFPNGISGDDLSDRALKQAGRFGAEIAMTRTIESLEPLSDGRYCVSLDGGQRISARVVLVAIGVEWRILAAEGVEQLQGRGVLYGASRNEASNVAGKRVFLVGGGNSAGQAAVFFANYAAEVTVLVRGKGLELTMSQYLIEQIRCKKNVHIEPFTEVVRAEGKDHLERIVTRTRHADGSESTQIRSADALFVMIGANANTTWLPKNMERDSAGYICTGRDLTLWNLEREPYPLETNLPGVFCAGDVRHDSIKRVSSGVGEGSMAVAFIHQYLALQNF